ncbi:carbon starvation induced protein CsiD, partial [Klebsiella pneumoniae]|uniref:carbon starvation induced protein CsiD n=1 Tax=Klebsiella pneumoniae TaxID=573 RepID=UPI0039C050CC
SFLLFQVGKIIDDLCGNHLQPMLSKTLLDREEGSLLINAEGIDHVSQPEQMVKLATAFAHLICRYNINSMSAHYNTPFEHKNEENT